MVIAATSSSNQIAHPTCSTFTEPTGAQNLVKYRLDDMYTRDRSKLKRKVFLPPAIQMVLYVIVKPPLLGLYGIYCASA